MRDRGEDVVIYGDSDPIVLTSQPRMFSIGLVLYRMRVTGSRGADLGAANHKTEITKLNAKKFTCSAKGIRATRPHSHVVEKPGCHKRSYIL